MQNKQDKRPATDHPEKVDWRVYSDRAYDDQWILKHVVMGWVATTIILLIVIITLSVLNHFNNKRWLDAWMEYDYSTETVTTTLESDGNSVANYTGGNGGVNYGGAGDSQENDPNENPE